jgi:hypothetical protein
MGRPCDRRRWAGGEFGGGCLMVKRKNSAPPATTATSATNAPKRYNRGKDGTHPLDKSFKPRPEGVVEELGGDELQKLRVTWSNEISWSAEGDFWRDLEIILGNCDEIMMRHGWDRKAGNGRNFPGDLSSDPFSELWYAGKIGHECWNLLSKHRERGPNEIALAQALYLGRLLTEADWRAAFKPSIVTGKDVRSGAKLGGEMRAGKVAPQTAVVIKEIRILKEQGHTISRAAELVAKRGVGKSAEANRRLWSRHKDK